jgi:fluoride exporter
VLTHAVLSHAKLSHAVLSHAVLSHAVLSHAVLSHAVLTHPVLSHPAATHAVLILAVLAGGMLGAPARYLVDRAIQARHDTVFPWGTFAVNMAGSALVGFLLGAQRHLGLPPAAFALLATGFCGGLTTFSAFGYETLRLLEDGAIGEAGVNVIGSLALGVLLAWLGFRLAVALLAAVRRASTAGHIGPDRVPGSPAEGRT